MSRILNLIIALVAVLSGYCTAMAQGDAPLVREGVKWVYDYSKMWVGSGTTTLTKEYLYFSGKKEIDGKTYSICHWSDVNSDSDTGCNRTLYLRQEGKQVFLRLDSLKNQKLDYRYPHINHFGNDPLTDKECLIYDFALLRGDSWKMLASCPEDPRDSDYISDGVGNIKVIDSVKYIQVNGLHTKVQYVHTPSAYKSRTEVVEGIGCLHDEVFPMPYIGPRTLGYIIHRKLVALEDMQGNVIHDFRVSTALSMTTASYGMRTTDFRLLRRERGQ